LASSQSSHSSQGATGTIICQFPVLSPAAPICDPGLASPLVIEGTPQHVAFQPHGLSRRPTPATFAVEEEIAPMIKRSLFALISFVALATAACGSSGSDSGIDRGKKVNSLSASERMTECTWGINEEGGENKTTTCTGGSTTTHTVARCVTDLGN